MRTETKNRLILVVLVHAVVTGALLVFYYPPPPSQRLNAKGQGSMRQGVPRGNDLSGIGGIPEAGRVAGGGD